MTNNTTTISIRPDATINEEMHGGKRFATEWETSNGSRYMVSSVDHDTATETMVFEVIDGHPTYYDLWTDREFRSNASQHAKFLGEFLENRER